MDKYYHGSMTWDDAKNQAELTGNFPENMPHAHIRIYKEWCAEVIFNEYHKINLDYTETVKNAKHQLIARYVGK